MTLQRLTQTSFPVNGVTGTSYSSIIDVSNAKTISVQGVVTVNTAAAGAFTAAVTDICTKSAHAFFTGLKVQLSTTTTLPAGLSLATDYFVIVIDADTFSLAVSLANALIGTAIDITTTGTGTHTITPTAIAGGTWSLQQSNDGTNYADIATATAVTASTVIFIEKVDPSSSKMRVKCVVTAGSYSSENYVLVKGEVA